jgi:hypothetical protein
LRVDEICLFICYLALRRLMSAAAQKLLGRLGSIGIGLAVAGGVAQSALYNGKNYDVLRLNHPF